MEQKKLYQIGSSCHAEANWTPWSRQLEVPAFSAGLQFGVSVFEGMQAHVSSAKGDYRIQFLDDHYARLTASSATVGIKIPTQPHFEAGVAAVVEDLLAARYDREDWSNTRIYIRGLSFSGSEDIFPRAHYPFLCNLFAVTVPLPQAPASLHLISDLSFIRAVPYSRIGAAKSAVNYTRIVELERDQPNPPQQQRLWLSPEQDRAVEELDTMGFGFVLDDGSLHTAPATASKLPSVTIKRLRARLAEMGHPVAETALPYEQLHRDLDSGRIVGLFGASTGKGLGIARQLTRAQQHYDLDFPPDVEALLWQAYRSMMET